MSQKLEMAAYKLFEEAMKTRFVNISICGHSIYMLILIRMKPHLMAIKDNQGEEEFYKNIRNTVAGCKTKWKNMNKVQWISFKFLI